MALITFDSQETIATNQVDPHDPSQGTDPGKECLNTIAEDKVTLMTASTKNGTVTSPGEGTVTYDWGAVVNLVATPDEHSVFVNWTCDTETIGNISIADTTIDMNGNYSITANFKVKKYKGDVNGDRDINLIDAILALQVIARIEPSTTVDNEADVDGDKRIGIEEVIYILQKISELR